MIDFEGHQDDAAVQEVMAELEPRMREVKWLGSYPKAVL